MVRSGGITMALKDFPVDECLLQGNAACPGCPATIGLRIVLKALGKKTILVIPACCTAVIESLYPATSFDVPVMNIAFEAAAAGASGVEAALRQQGRTDITVAAWAGDGGDLRHRHSSPVRCFGTKNQFHLYLLQQSNLFEHRHPAQWCYSVCCLDDDYGGWKN